MIFEKYIIENELGTIEGNCHFKDITTIGCGGKIKVLYSPKDIDSLKKAFKFINDHNLKYFIIGNGSNVLARDNDYNGIVISLRKLSYDYKIDNDILTCSAFYPTIKLAYDLAKKEYGDLSFLGGIPGLLGGAIYNNSGAYNDDISSHLIDVTYINSNGDVKTSKANNLAFGYRRSIFHSFKCIIISARFKIEKINTFELLNKRTRDRKLSQPVNCKSMGSIFKNNKLISAWKVVDALGMRGFSIRDAAVSSKHANFIINLNQAKSIDIENLIELIKKRAELEFGIKLISEISFVS